MKQKKGETKKGKVSFSQKKRVSFSLFLPLFLYFVLASLKGADKRGASKSSKAC